MSAGQLKVIVVGGGPVGLTAAVALERAGIDFVVLERRSEVVINAGSSLVLNPEGLGAMTQLGLLDDLNAVSSELGKIDRVDHSGRSMGDMQWFVLMKKILGTAPRVITRHDLTQTLYSSLSAAAQAKIHPNKKLSDIKVSENGATAHCTDGTSYAGAFIIGADGAHSMVRDLMQKMQSASDSTPSPFLTTYRCLWLRFPRPSNMPVGTTSETHGHLAATQLFAGEDTAVTGVYERMEKPTRDRVRYTEVDQDALVQRWGHIPVTGDGKLTLRQAYESRIASGLVSLEEGVVEDWSFDGRIVLAGDAAHKFTPSMGSGCNNGIIDIIHLVNELDRTLKNSSSTHSIAGNIHPSTQDIDSAFRAYQNQRYEAVVAGCKASGNATATATWQNGIYKMVDRHLISSHKLQRFFFSQGAKSATRTPVTFGCRDGDRAASQDHLGQQVVAAKA